jgi:hypothetical protein
MHCWFSSVITVDFNSFAPLSLFGHPVLVVALEKVERSSGTLIGSSIATIQKSAAPEMLLALMDEAYTGSAIEDSRGNSGSDDSSPLDLADPMFLDLLKDENDGIAVSSFSYTIVYVQCFYIPPEFLDYLFLLFPSGKTLDISYNIFDITSGS